MQKKSCRSTSKVNVELKNLKIHDDMSEETTCFSASIYFDGKKIGTVQNKGRGGSHNYYWSDNEAGRRLNEWAKAQPTEFEFDKLDQFIDGLIDKAEILAQLKRWVKKATIFRLKGDKPGEWRMVKKGYVLRVVAFLTKKYGNKLEIVVDPANLNAALPFCR